MTTPLPKDRAWTEHSEARALLADLGSNPPPTRYVTGTFGANDGEVRYTSTLADRRVADLRRLHDAAWEAAHELYCDGKLTRDDMDAMFPCDEQRAIADAVEAGRSSATQSRRAA